MKKDYRVYFVYALGRFLIGNEKKDKLYLKILFRLLMKRKCDFENPRSYSEKLQWLKIYDRKPKYTLLVDKYEVRDYVRKQIGEKYLIPCLGIWNSFNDIDFDVLPNQFVIKCTHDSGGVVICKDKSQFNIKEAKKRIKHSFRRNYYKNLREWPYKNVMPRIIAESYMVDESGYELKDYKFFCFNGEPKILFVASDRGKDTKFDFYDTGFNHLNILNGHQNAEKKIVKPKNFNKMLEIASQLSKGLCNVRVDLYNINGNIYFGEMTFFHWSGLVPFYPEEWDYTLGSWLELPS